MRPCLKNEKKLKSMQQYLQLVCILVAYMLLYMLVVALCAPFLGTPRFVFLFSCLVHVVRVNTDSDPLICVIISPRLLQVCV